MEYGEFQINQLSRILAETGLYKYGDGSPSLGLVQVGDRI